MFYSIMIGIVTLLKALDFIYLFQIKEYRLDRMMNLFREEGIGETFYLRSPQMPSQSTRNKLIVLILIMQLIAILYLLHSASVGFKIAFIILNPVIAFLMVLFAVFVTGIAASFQHNRIIERAKKQIANSDAQYIGITGSYGKTSIKEFLYEILATSFTVAKTEANMNTDVGVAISVLKHLTPETQYFITEMGAYRVGEIAKICDLVHPRYAILNPISNQHLGLFGSKANLIKTKLELLHALPQEGSAYIHVANRPLADLASVEAEKIYYGSGASATITLNDVTHMSDHIVGKIHYKDHIFPIEIHLLGLHNIENVLAAIAVALDLGVGESHISRAVKSLKNLPGKLSVHTGLNGSTVLNDSLNSNVEGFLSAIQTTTHSPHTSKLVISKGIIELGVEKEPSYKRILEQLYLKQIRLLTTDPFFKKLDMRNSASLYKNEEDLLAHLQKTVDTNTLLVLEGKFTPKFTHSVTLNP